MADRTVSARLRLDVAGYLANARAAQVATRRIADEADRAGGRAGTSFAETSRSVEQTSRSFQVAGASARRAGADIEGASLAVRRAQLAAADATVKAEKAQRAAAAATQRLARGEIDQAEASRLAGVAERDIERASIAHAAAAQRASAETDRHSAAERRLGGELQTTARGLTANRSTLVSLVTAGVAAGAAATAAGVAFGAFGVLAAGSIVPVVAAQKDLARTWGTLDGRQRVAALSVRALTDDYKGLAKSFEPQAFAAFNNVIGTTRALLPQVGAVANATAGDVTRLVNRLGEFTTGRLGGEFLSWAGRIAPQALDLLGTTMITAGDTALDLIQDIAPLGISMLQLTNGTLGALNAVARFNPLLAQVAVTGLALRAPVTGIVERIGAMSGRMRTASAAAQGMSRSSRLLNIATAAGPNLYVAAGVALGFLALKLFSAKDGTDRLIESLKLQRQAAGNSLQVYQQQAAFLQNKYLQTIRDLRDSLQGDIGAGDTGLPSEVKRLHEEAVKAQTRLANLTSGADQLAGQFGVTREQATRLADVAGVDLSTSMDKSGKLSAAASLKVAQYEQAVQLAADPTRMMSLALRDAGNSALAMKDRVNALTAGLNAFFNPGIAVFKLTGQLKDGYRQLISQLDAAKGRMNGNSAASGQLRQAFAAQLETVRDLYLATFNQTHSTGKASAAVRAQLPVLYALAGNNKDARAQVDALARSTFNTVGATNTSKAAFIAQARSMGISKERAAALWQEFRKVTTVADTTNDSLTLLARERKLKMNIADWQSKITTGKRNLASVPPEKRAKMLANIRDLEAKVRKAKQELASVHDKQVTITTILRKIGEGKYVTGTGRVHHARGGVFGPGQVRRYAAGDVARAVPADHTIPPNVTGQPVALYGESGPEAYIPLDPARRERSTEILGMVADMFGMRLVPMAAGGVTAQAAGGTRPEAGAGPTGGGQKELTEALRGTKGQLDQNSAASLQLRERFAAQLTAVRELNNATLTQTARNREAKIHVDALSRSTTTTIGRQNAARTAFATVSTSMAGARNRTEQLWREYGKVPGQTSRAAGGVENFRGRTTRAIQALRSKSLRVTVFADGKFSKAKGLAVGGPVPADRALGAGGPTSDDVPLWGSVGEHMLAADEVRAAGGHAAVYRMRKAMLRGEMRGFAAGGAVDFSARTPSAAQTAAATRTGSEHLKLLRSGQAAFDEAHAMALAWKKYAASGGAVVAAARSQIGLPYSWGGGGRGGPSYGIGRGAHTFGFDCSGLTEFAWWRGRRVGIGGTTGPQHANSRPISGWRPAALAFPHSSHVMLGSSRPGYVIQAPHTGAHVEEVRRSAGDWRWPTGAGMARGGAVTHDEARLGDRFLRGGSRTVIIEAKRLQIAGDPGGVIPGYAGGGWVRGRTGPDRVPLLAAGGEFMVNRTSAGKYAPLVEAINADRVGDALLRRYIRGYTGPVAGGDGAAAAGGGAMLHITLNLAGQTIGELVIDPLRKSIRSRGGDVQATLGSGR